MSGGPPPSGHGGRGGGGWSPLHFRPASPYGPSPPPRMGSPAANMFGNRLPYGMPCPRPRWPTPMSPVPHGMSPPPIPPGPRPFRRPMHPPVHDNESQNTDEDSDTPSLAPQNAGPSRSSITPAPFAPPPKRVRKVGHLAKQNELLSMACTYLREAKEPPQDDVRAVTKVWSEKLQTLEHQQRLFAEKAINDILFEATMGNLHRYSVRINEDFYPQRNASVQSFSSTSQSVASSLPSPTEAEEELPQLSTFYTTFTPL